MNDSDENATLPKGWVTRPIGDVLDAKYGKSLPGKKRKPGDVPVYGANGMVGSHDAAITAAPVIVIGRKGSVGAVNYSSKAAWPIDTTYFIDDFRAFAPSFLRKVLRSLRLNEMDRSTAIPGLSRQQLYERELVVPPLAEQGRIAARLDEVELRRAATAAHLQAARAVTSRFRSAVFAAACSGRLTEEWREDRDAPEWQAGAASDVCAKVQSGTTPKRWHDTAGGVPFLKVYNIVAQRLDFDSRPQFIAPELHRGPMRRATALPGDVVMNIVGPPLGKVAVVTEQYPEWSINQALTLFRPSEAITSEWLYLFLCSGISVSTVLDRTRGSVGQVNISLTQCRNFQIPVPSLDEQHEITRRANTMLAAADRLETQIARAAATLDRASAGALAKAFRGELVPTEAELAEEEGREFESGEELLARIDAAQAPKTRQGRRDGA